MSNRLEWEFPELTWAPPPSGACGLPPEMTRACVERGRELRSGAIGNSARSAGAALVRRLLAAAAFVQRAVGGPARRARPQGDCWPAPRRALHRRWP